MAETSVTLLIRVVDDAQRELQRLRRTARQTEEAVEGLERAAVGNRLERSVRGTNNELLRTRAAARNARTAANQLSRDTVTGQARAQASITRTSRTLGVLRSGFGSLIAQVAVLAGGFQLVQFGRDLLSTSQAALQLQGRLRLVTESTAELNALQNELFRVSQETRTALQSNAELFTRVRLATRELGVADADLIGLITTLNQAIQVSGASSVEASQGVIQFAQGLASGTLRGDELRSVLEQLPGVALALADGLGVTVGQLRELGEQGELTADRVIEALRNSADEVEEQFAQIPRTVGQAITQIRNALIQAFTGEEAQPVIDSLNDLREALEDPGTQEALRDLVVGISEGVSLLVDGAVALTEAFRDLRATDTIEEFEELSGTLQTASLAFNGLRLAIGGFLAPFRALGAAIDAVNDGFATLFDVTEQQRAAAAFSRTIIGIEEDFIRTANLAPEAAQAVADAFADIRQAVAVGDISQEEGLRQAEEIARGTLDLAEEVASERQRLQEQVTARQVEQGRRRILQARAEVRDRIASNEELVQNLEAREEELTDAIAEEQQRRVEIQEQSRSQQESIAEAIQDAQRGLFSEGTRDALEQADRVRELREAQQQLADAARTGNTEQVEAVNETLDALRDEAGQIDSIVERLAFLRQLQQAQQQVDEAASQAAVTAEQARSREVEQIREATVELERRIRQQRDTLQQLGDALAQLEIEPIDVTFDISTAEEDLETLEQRLDRLRRSAQVVFGGIGSVTGGAEFHRGGPVRGFQSGGTVSGPGGRDRVPARLTAGEFVVNRDRAQMFPRLLDALNFGSPADIARSLERTLPRLQPSAVQAVRGTSQDLLTLDFRINGRTAATMTGARDEALAVARALEEMRRGLGRRG